MHAPKNLQLALPMERDQALSGGPFLPLAFRFAVSFGLIVLQIALPSEGARPHHEDLYLWMLLIIFAESAWEAAFTLKREGNPFATPRLPWIRFNLFLDILLISVLIAYQGVDQERFATIYIFPVLASAFYLRTTEIMGVGLVATLAHIFCVLAFSKGWLPPFGRSGLFPDFDSSQQFFVLSFATLQIFLAMLVVVLIRKHLESLRTTLQRSEATVDELSALYRRVFESMFSGIVTLDLDGRITSANPAAENILQRPLPPGTLLGDLGLDELFEVGTLPREQRFERAFETRKQGARILGGNVAPLRDSEGIQTGHLLLFQDLTEIKALEERTRISERLAAIGEISAELAHEIRNPVASILGCAQLLSQPDHPRTMTDRVVTILKRESERVSALVSDFLDFTRPRPVTLQSCWLPGILDEVRASWEMDARNAGIPLQVEPLPEVWVKGDPQVIHQVFSNLLSNARKALKNTEHRLVRIRSQQLQPGRLTLQVQDTGCGMSPEQLHGLFLPFSSGFQEGTGLGMSLVFQFVQKMGWDIRVESEEGQGTRVFLEIPLAGGQDGNLLP